LRVSVAFEGVWQVRQVGGHIFGLVRRLVAQALSLSDTQREASSGKLPCGHHILLHIQAK
jgi:hypothetical protein